MGFLEKVSAFLEPVIEVAEKILDWFSDPDNQDQVKEVIRFILSIVTAVGSLNDPLPKRDRPKAVRTVVEVLRKIPPDGLREMADIKENTNIDKMTNGELDILIGQVVGGYVTTEKAEKKKGKAK